MAFRISIVEDDPKIAASVGDYLRRYGYEVAAVDDFNDAEAEVLAFQPHLIIMDVNLPYQDGFMLTRRLRQRSTVPILFLSARSGEMEQVFGIESGGDDYVTKPFSLEVLHAKIRSLLRRAYGEYVQAETDRAVLSAGELSLHLVSGTASTGGRQQSLTPNEVKLLHLLLQHTGKIVTREQCLEALWDDSSFVDDNTLTVNVTRLRQKLAALGFPEAIETRRGQGYRLVPERLTAGAATTKPEAKA